MSKRNKNFLFSVLVVSIWGLITYYIGGENVLTSPIELFMLLFFVNIILFVIGIIILIKRLRFRTVNLDGFFYLLIGNFNIYLGIVGLYRLTVSFIAPAATTLTTLLIFCSFIGLFILFDSFLSKKEELPS